MSRGAAHLVVTFVVAAMLVGYAWTDSEHVATALYLAVVWGASAAAWLGALRARPGDTPAMVLIAAGVTATSVGEALWFHYFWSGPPTDVSLADAAYLIGYLGLVGAAVVTLVRAHDRSRQRDLDAVVDALTVVVVSVVVVWNLSVDAIIRDPSVPLPVAAVWAAYPLLDAVLLALVVRLLLGRGRQLIGPAFAGGVLAWLIADFSNLTVEQTDTVILVEDTLWMLAMVLMAVATWRQGTLPDDGQTAEEERRSAAAQVLIATVPLMVPVTIEFWNHLQGRERAPYAAVVSMTLLVALAHVRTLRLLKAENRARLEARASQRHYERLAANSSDAVIVVGVDGRVREQSAQLHSLLGRSGSSGAASWIDELKPLDAAPLPDGFVRVVDRPESTVTVEAEVEGPPGGEPMWVRARMVSLVDDPDVGGVVVGLSDVTRSKRVERELAQARDAALDGTRAKAAFLATMSHEIRTPLNGVIGLSELLLMTDLDERQSEYGRGIKAAGDALLSIINDILDFSKIEAGKLTLESVDFDLTRVVEETAALVAQTAQGKGLELLAYCSPDVPVDVRGDPARLRQVLLNLTANAVKFTDRGEVVVSVHLVEREGDRITLRFEVRDTGIGVDPQTADRLFAPFAQADSSTTRRYGGTGLGLTISQQLVSAMGGQLGVTSSAGEGATFWFTLPVAPAAAPVAADRTAMRELSGVRALIVDDNATNRLILTDQLHAWGMEAEALDNATDALERLESAARDGDGFDLVVLDLLMPDVDGVELARRIGERPSLSEIGTLMLTSAPGVTREELEEAGVDACLAKPVRLSELRTKISEVLPMGGDETAAVAPAPGSARTGRGHVLVVEDNPINQLVAVGMLRRLGCTTEVAGDGREALAALSRGHFDAVLMDCQMPGMDGYEATAELRSRETAEAHLPVVAMTAAALEGDRQRCLAAGMDDYVTKPVTIDALEAALAVWLDSPRPVRGGGVTGA